MTFKCPKCGCESFKVGELRGSSGGISAWLDVDLAIFTTLTCANCGFTELFGGYANEFKRHHGLEGGPLFDGGEDPGG